MLIYENKMGTSQAFYDPVGCIPHLHHHIELIYMDDGTNDATVGSYSCTISKDDVLIAFPNQIHSYDLERKNKSYILIYSPDDFPCSNLPTQNFLANSYGSSFAVPLNEFTNNY